MAYDVERTANKGTHGEEEEGGCYAVFDVLANIGINGQPRGGERLSLALILGL
jgi:hypothetical protein